MTEPKAAASTRGELPRAFTTVDAAALFVGIILGSGIFVAPAAVSAALPSPRLAVALWILGGLVTVCGALCYAECGARVPRTGGFYVFYQEAYGEAVAFVGGWIALFVTYPASVAAIARVFANYLAEVLGPRFGFQPNLPAVAVIVAGAMLNVFGTRTGAWAQRLLSGTKVVALAALCGAAIFAGRSGVAPATTLGSSGGWFGAALLLAGTAVLWTYDGWTDVTLVAGELRDPGKNLRRAVLWGTAVLVALYAAVQVSVSLLLPGADAANSPRAFAAAVEAGLGPGAGRAVALLVVLSTFGSVTGIILGISRLCYAMARDGAFIRWFGHAHPRWNTPARATLAVATASVFYVFVAQFQALLNYFSFCAWIFYSLTAIALIRFRRQRVGEQNATAFRRSTITPLVVLATGVFMTAGQLTQNPKECAYGLLMLAAAFASYFVWRRARTQPT